MAKINNLICLRNVQHYRALLKKSPGFPTVHFKAGDSTALMYCGQRLQIQPKVTNITRTQYPEMNDWPQLTQIVAFSLA